MHKHTTLLPLYSPPHHPRHPSKGAPAPCGRGMSIGVSLGRSVVTEKIPRNEKQPAVLQPHVSVPSSPLCLHGTARRVFLQLAGCMRVARGVV